MSTRGYTTRLVQLLSLVLCYSMLFSTLLIMKPQASLAGGQGHSRGGRPEAGPPTANLPNLDEVRSKRQPQPQAPPQVPSTMRARRKPLLPRNGLKVGDPGTTLGTNGLASGNNAAAPPLDVRMGSALPPGTTSENGSYASEARGAASNTQANRPERQSLSAHRAAQPRNGSGRDVSPDGSAYSTKAKLNHTSTKTRSLPLAVPPPIGTISTCRHSSPTRWGVSHTQATRTNKVIGTTCCGRRMRTRRLRW